MMKRLLAIAATLVLAGCSQIHLPNRGGNPYDNPFYAKYLNTGSALDAQINRTLEGLRANPRSAPLHNDLGQLLMAKGFPKDAEREFERSVNADGRFYPAWYNLGLVRAARGDDFGARRALYRTVSLKPGHATALFQLGLIEELQGDTDQAIDLYAKAYRIDRSLLKVHVNPRILDSKLTQLAMLKAYPRMHTRQSMQFVRTPDGYKAPNEVEAVSPQPAPEKIITPVPAETDRQPH